MMKLQIKGNNYTFIQLSYLFFFLPLKECISFSTDISIVFIIYSQDKFIESLLIHLDSCLKAHSPEVLLLVVFWQFQHHTIPDPCGFLVMKQREHLSSPVASFLGKTQRNKATEKIFFKAFLSSLTLHCGIEDEGVQKLQYFPPFI